MKQKSREVFLPLSHPPGELQVDYGFADVWLKDELPCIDVLETLNQESESRFKHFAFQYRKAAAFTKDSHTLFLTIVSFSQ